MSIFAKRSLTVLGLGAVLSLVLFSVAIRPARAVDGILVNSAADTVAVDTFCTLREAIQNANDTTTGQPNTDCVPGDTGGADEIKFAADYTITLSGSQLPAVTSVITIAGNGAANTIIQANAAANTATYRVFEVSSTGNLTLDGLTVRHGVCGGACATFTTGGGGIFNLNGTVTVTNSTLSDNTATSVGGGFTGGGGIYNLAGTLTVANSTLSGNSTSNQSNGGLGGGIYSSDPGVTLTVTNSTLSGNSAGLYGGGIYSSSGPTIITNSTLSSNSAGSSGGGIYTGSGTTTVTYSTLRGNAAGSGSLGGGGIFSGGTTTVTNSTLSRNSAPSGSGGGIFVGGGATTVTNATFYGNRAAIDGASVYVPNGAATLTNSLLTANLVADHCSGVTANASNIADDNTCDSATQKTVGEINLDTTLADNGGPTFTHALLAGSHAIDFDTTASCAAAPVNGVDQRSYSRNIDGNGAASANECDAGAFEYGGLPAFCTGFPMSVGTETQLNEAITCYNLQIAAATYTIDLTAPISLTRSTVAIDNAIAGIELLLDGNGFAVDGQGIGGVRPFEIKRDTDATFDNITIMGGSRFEGGGIYSRGTLAVLNSTISGNSADFGGGIYSLGTLAVTDSTLSGNAARFGGGILNRDRLTVTSSTFSGNMATAGVGGGIDNSGTVATVTNSTFSGNSAALSGGGIFNQGQPVTVTNSTFFGNSADRGGGAVYGNGTTVTNSLLTGTTAGGNCSDVTADASNISDDNTCDSATQKTAGEINLDTTLADNGGPTFTHALLSGSHAIDFDTTASCAAAPVNGVDQRGEPRSIDIPGEGNDGGANLCDTGAFEVQLPPAASACPVDPEFGTVGNELTTLLGAGMGSPTRSRMVAKVVIPNAAGVTDLYGQMAAKEYNGVKYVRFIFGDKSFEQVQPETDLGDIAAISWWGADLTTDFQLQAKPFVKGRWFLQKGMKKMRIPRAIVFYATHDTGDTEYANAWSTFTYPDNFVAGTTGFDQTNTNLLPIPETQATTDIVVQLAVTDVNRDPRTVDVIVRAGGVEVTTTLTGPTNKKSELLNLFEVTLEDVPAGVDEVEIELVSVLDEGDSAALLGAAAHYECGATLPPASITLEKVLNGPAPQEPWEFELVLPDQQDTVLIEVAPEGGSLKIFEGQLFGEFTITETPVEFWETSVECNNGVTSDSNSITFNLLPGQDVICTFDNELPR